MNQVRLWVHPEFKKKLKREAAEQDLSILELTEKLSRDEYNRIKARGRYDFRF
jgi:hypothetical protein